MLCLRQHQAADVVPQPAGALYVPRLSFGGRSPYDLICVEEFGFQGCPKCSKGSKAPTAGSKREVIKLRVAATDVLTLE